MVIVKRFVNQNLFRKNYKKDDVFKVENEEMSCDDLNINYDTLSKFFVKGKKLT